MGPRERRPRLVRRRHARLLPPVRAEGRMTDGASRGPSDSGKPYGGRRVFQLGPGWTLLYVGLTALFAAGALVTYRQGGWSWVSLGLAFAAAVLGLGSILESFILRIEL